MTPRATFTLFILLLAGPTAQAGFLPSGWTRDPAILAETQKKLRGRILDFTANHGCDRRIWSPALGSLRDLYVYLPPGFDPNHRYPIAFFFHGFLHDEISFLQFVEHFDEGMASGRLPPVIIAVPDGSIRGHSTIRNGGSFYVNSKAGCFEDYVMRDVWDFMHTNFPIRPEREAHCFIGGSMGGFSAYYLGIKYRDRVGMLVGVFPPVNLRYINCRGRYFANFDPTCLAWRERLQPWGPVGRYFGGLITIRQRRVLTPLFGDDPDAIHKIAAMNPVEMLSTHDVRPGELEMYICYVGRDQFNIDAQVDSFVYMAHQRGLTVSTNFLPEGKHDPAWAIKMMPAMLAWMGPRLRPYCPFEGRIKIDE